MAEELSYVVITDKSLTRSLTGDIIKEVFSGGVNALELLAARVYAPSRRMIENYITTMRNESFGKYLKREYIKNNSTTSPKRMMFLLFRGEEAISQLRGIVGPVSRRIDGTLRNKFAEFIETDGDILGFVDPAVLILPDKGQAIEKLKVWSDYAESDGGLLDKLINWDELIDSWDEHETGALVYREGISKTREELKSNIQTTLILIKPDNIYEKSRRVGEIINAFSGTGIKLIGAKAVNMSIREAEEFYDPIKPRLIKKFGEKEGSKQFNELIKFMTGKDSSKITAENERLLPGTRQSQSLSLVYQGPFVVERIRKKVGATNPEEAEPGTIRREYGHDIMKNGVHASDSEESAKREIRILDIQSSPLKEII